MPVASVGISQLAEVCGTEFFFSADTLGYGWAEFEWSSPFLPVVFSDASLPNSEVSISTDAFGDSAHVSIDFVWTASNLTCLSTDTMHVTFYQRPVAFAGDDDAVCGNQYNLHAELSIPESSNYTPLMQWGIAGHPSGESADISSINVAQTTLTVSSSGLWEVTLTERNSLLSSCYSRDTAIIEFVEIPVVNAGPDFSVCGSCVFIGDPYLDGYFTSECTGWYSWQYEEICVAEYDVFTFVYHEFNSAQFSALTCEGTDSFDVAFWRMPTANIITDSIDEFVCGNQYDNLIAEAPDTGNFGYWWSPTTDYVVTLSDSTAITEVDYYGPNNYFWVETFVSPEYSAFCSDTAGPITLTFLIEEPIFAGCDMIVTDEFVELNAISNAGFFPNTECSYQWTCANATIYNPQNLDAFAVLPEFGEYYFVLHSYYNNLLSCYDSDTVKINYLNPNAGVIESENFDFSIFPNPTTGQITLQSEHRVESVIITDINGKQVLQIESPPSIIDISSFEQGIYFLQIETREGIVTTKIVKQ
jgi:hypothetical protein